MEQHVELVEIVEDSNHNVAARDCHLSIKNEHAIRWINRTSTAYTIDFEESPLEADLLINVPAGSKRKPGESATLKLKARAPVERLAPEAEEVERRAGVPGMLRHECGERGPRGRGRVERPAAPSVTLEGGDHVRPGQAGREVPAPELALLLARAGPGEHEIAGAGAEQEAHAGPRRGMERPQRRLLRGAGQVGGEPGGEHGADLGQREGAGGVEEEAHDGGNGSAQIGSSSRTRTSIAAWGTTRYFFSSKVISTAALRKKIA